MQSRLFHTLIVCGAALAVPPLGCASDAGSGDDHAPARAEAGAAGAGATATDPLERCRAPDGGCNEHCAALANGVCLDPCFVHTESCSSDCRLPSGECGWPPTK